MLQAISHDFLHSASATTSPPAMPQIATLYQSKSGKVWSDKLYRVSILGVKVAAFGTTKKVPSCTPTPAESTQPE